MRLKLSGVGHCMLRQYLDMALDAAYNSPSPPVKIGALKLIETFMLVFPNGIVGKLPEIRDIYRSLMIDKDPEVAEAAYRYYPIIFRGVTTMIAPEFFKYLTDELATFKKKGDQNNEQSLMQASDPLSNNLNNDEEIRIIKATILALGALNERSMAFNIINELLPFIKGSNSILRWAATTSILSQVSFISDNQANAILWSLIPLYFDPNPEIRKALVNFINRSSTCWDTLAISLSAHPDDTFVYPSE